MCFFLLRLHAIIYKSDTGLGRITQQAKHGKTNQEHGNRDHLRNHLYVVIRPTIILKPTLLPHTQTLCGRLYNAYNNWPHAFPSVDQLEINRNYFNM